ncbi:hypothetical protein [Isoptericola dokdonensis]|uniref:Uncharacterized protein n=1 Tax=Isoptericola dokdonensis DS-3 TaxID=1300344 RepID=A0A168FDH5_9MICO|nr:hypothetical protein [Isoptericola dokdonensis]ANC31439.1 hypothetical protein I598_1891 [Isoptericola dokdonensis DS-3]
MRLRNGSPALLNLTDGSILRGTVRRSWRWRVVRLEAVHAFTGPGEGRAVDGHIFVPHRSILTAQVTG